MRRIWSQAGVAARGHKGPVPLRFLVGLWFCLNAKLPTDTFIFYRGEVVGLRFQIATRDKNLAIGTALPKFQNTIRRDDDLFAGVSRKPYETWIARDYGSGHAVLLSVGLSICCVVSALGRSINATRRLPQVVNQH